MDTKRLEIMFSELLRDYERAEETCINEFAINDMEEQQNQLEKDIKERKKEFKKALLTKE